MLLYLMAILLVFGRLVASRSYCDYLCYCDSKFHWICRLPKSSFQSIDLNQLPSSLRKLELINLQLKQTGRLVKFKNLIEMRLRNAGLSELPKNFLQANLIALDVSNNNLKKLTSTMLQMPALEQLDLSKNQLTSIDHLFDRLSALKQLNLSSNLISRLSESSFRNLTKLQYLNLKSNRIHQIELGTFYQLNNLVKLVLDNNMRLDHLKLDLFELRMRSLHLTQTNLTIVPQSINEHIRELYLDHNLLERLSIGDFEHLTNLRILHLEHNHLREIEFDTFGRMNYLVELYLSSNHLLQVPDQLPKLLRTLSLSDNLITELNCSNLKHLLQLETLDLSTNHIHALDAVCLSPFINIQHLDLSENQLSNVDGQFNNLKQLRSLNLSGNELIRLSARSWLGLENLKQLELSSIGRKMPCFGELYIFDHLSQLQVFNLSASPSLATCFLDFSELRDGLQNGLKDGPVDVRRIGGKEEERKNKSINRIEKDEVLFPSLEKLILKDMNILGQLNLTKLRMITPQLVVVDVQNSTFDCDNLTLRQITSLINDSLQTSIELVNLDEWTCERPKRLRNLKIVDLIFDNQTTNHHFKRLLIESTKLNQMRKFDNLMDFIQPKAHQLVNFKQQQIKWSKLMSSDSQFVSNKSFVFFDRSNYSVTMSVLCCCTLIVLLFIALTHQLARRYKISSKLNSFIRSFHTNPLTNKSKRFKHVNYSKQQDDVFIITQCSNSDFQSSSDEPLLDH